MIQKKNSDIIISLVLDFLKTYHYPHLKFDYTDSSDSDEDSNAVWNEITRIDKLNTMVTKYHDI